MLDAGRTRLWHALGLGPVWRERDAAGAHPAGDVHPAAGLPAPGTAGVSADLPEVLADRAVPDSLARPLVASAGSRAAGQPDTWEGLQAEVAACTACGLCQSRTQTVFGVGSQGAPWLVVGEAPGAEEDAQGEPFVGQAGRLLDAMLAAAGMGRAHSGAGAVYIANAIKCRPPGNRNPQASELAACRGYLDRQIELLAPRAVIALGRFAAQTLLQTDAPVGSLRGRVHTMAAGGGEVPVIVTYHPAYLLRSPAEKARAWEDLCLARRTGANISP